jgi:hypothetical protein
MTTLADINTKHTFLLEENIMLHMMKDAIAKINADMSIIDMRKGKFIDTIESNTTLNSYIF